MSTSVHKNTTGKREHLITLHLRILERSSGERWQLSHLDNVNLNVFHDSKNQLIPSSFKWTPAKETNARKLLISKAYFLLEWPSKALIRSSYQESSTWSKKFVAKSFEDFSWIIYGPGLWQTIYNTFEAGRPGKGGNGVHGVCQISHHQNTSHRFSTSDIPMHSWRNWSYPVMIQLHIV